MKRLFVILLMTLVLALPLFSIAGKVSYIEGQVMINYAMAELRQEVREGDFISTQKGKLEITLDDGTLVRVGPESKVYMESLKEEKGRKKVSIKVALGRFWTKVKKLVAKDEYNVSFRTGTAGVRGTVYRIDQYADDSAQLFVYDGKVEVRGEKPSGGTDQMPAVAAEIDGPVEIEGPQEVSMEEWVKIVKRLNRIAISPEGVPTDPAEFDLEKDKQDPWVQWNLQRDGMND
ncbi:MAG TPA: FecR family protein [Candidatus Mcinerneyibacteriales bacterium]|nr:FecR family protein [Candidatus Mcinerneyibacteriales bacterium]